SIGENFDIGELRYHKIIIATDADVDGAHIRTLLLTLFYRHFPTIISGGYLYIAQPPLFKIKKGKEIVYSFSEEDKNKIVKRLGGKPEDLIESDLPAGETGTDVTETEVKVAKVSVQRYKGLGEMNPEELWETTMDPEKRILKRVDIKDAEESDKTFTVLMGAEVEPRKIFIQTHAKLANLDV
ncbi:MAG: toprim domain-containing protein, partial [Patescibacteria group bacterium]